MAGEAVVGALRIVLGMDVGSIDDGTKAATAKLQSFGHEITKIAAGFGLATSIESAFEKIVESINHAVESADKLSKASQKFGIGTDELQVLAHAAALSDVSLEDLSNAFSRLSKNVIASAGPTSDQAAAFKALGISFQEVVNLKPDQIFLKVADAISKYGDGVGKTAAVQAIFGKGAAAIIPVLNQGSEGIDELRGSMQKFGQIVDGDTIKAAEKLKDTLTDLGKTKDSLILKILGQSGLLSAMQSLAQSFVESAGDTDKFRQNFGPLVDIIKGTATDIANIVAGFDALKKAAANANSAADEGTLAWLGFEYGIEGVGQAVAPIPAIINETTTEVAKSAAEYASMAEGLKAVAAAAKSVAPQLAFNPQNNKELENFNKHLRELQSAAQDASGIFVGQLAPGFLSAAAHMDLLKNEVQIVDGSFATLGPHAAQLNDALLKIQGFKLQQENLSGWDALTQKIAASDLALQKIGASQELILTNTARLTGEYAGQVAGFFGNLEQGFAAAGEKNKSFATLAKGLAIAQATFNTYEAATKAYALFGGWPLGAAAAAATVAAGLAMVAKISSTGFASGGSFQVGGGISHVDNQLVTVPLASGEMVNVHKASQGGGGSSGTVSEIALTGISSKDLFTGDMLRGLVNALNAGYRDGYKLKVS